ncbi:hypothetical protein DY000_02063175 [Brassica cretica]|uniref:Uncharacterized protein n=1 Tax=Brassica cretica TaxID=69181 RepID=A0ABQ7AUM0_BRACR|nr:hypothetical protein DY000_02063175 [Brassica cretica]
METRATSLCRSGHVAPGDGDASDLAVSLRPSRFERVSQRLHGVAPVRSLPCTARPMTTFITSFELQMHPNVFKNSMCKLPFHRRPRSISGDGFFSDGGRMHVTGGKHWFSASIHHQRLYSSLIHRRSFYSSEIHAGALPLLHAWSSFRGIKKCSGALGSVLVRPAVSSMIGYTTLTYVPRDSPQRSVHLAIRAWDNFLETATRTDLIRRDPQGNEPAAVQDGTGNPFDISTI